MDGCSHSSVLKTALISATNLLCFLFWIFDYTRQLSRIISGSSLGINPGGLQKLYVIPYVESSPGQACAK